MQVWSSGFYGETINYLDVAYSERNCLVFDQSLLCVDDYSVCVVCVRVCVWQRIQTATCNIAARCKETRSINRFNNCVKMGAAECIQTTIMSFLTPAADQMDNMLPPLHYSTASSGNQIWMQYFTASLLNQNPCFMSPFFPLFRFHIPFL